MSRGLGRVERGIIDFLWVAHTNGFDGATVGTLVAEVYGDRAGDYEDRVRVYQEAAVRRALRKLRRVGIVASSPAVALAMRGQLPDYIDADTRAVVHRLTAKAVADLEARERAARSAAPSGQ